MTRSAVQHGVNLIVTPCIALALGCWSAGEVTGQNRDNPGPVRMHVDAGPRDTARSYNPVMVVSDDEAKDTAKRSFPFVRKVIAGVQRTLGRGGFHVVDNRALAGELGLKIRDRQRVDQLVGLIKLASRSGKAEHQVRILVLLRSRLMVAPSPGPRLLRAEIDVDLLDLPSNRAIGSVSLPAREFPLPRGCGGPCISDVANRHAPAIAATLGTVLATKLQGYRHVSADSARRRGSSEATAAAVPYTVTLLDFDRRTALAVIDVMSNEFPGYSSHQLIGQTGGRRNYAYLTSASLAKLEEWIHILLGDMKLAPGKKVAVRSSGNHITIERLAP